MRHEASAVRRLERSRASSVSVRFAAVMGADVRIEYLDYTPERLGRWTSENDVWTVAAARIIGGGHGRASSIVVAAFGYELVGLTVAERSSRRLQAITRGRQVLDGVIAEWCDRLADVDVITTIA